MLLGTLAEVPNTQLKLCDQKQKCLKNYLLEPRHAAVAQPSSRLDNMCSCKACLPATGLAVWCTPVICNSNTQEMHAVGLCQSMRSGTYERLFLRHPSVCLAVPITECEASETPPVKLSAPHTVYYEAHAMVSASARARRAGPLKEHAATGVVRGAHTPDEGLL